MRMKQFLLAVALGICADTGVYAMAKAVTPFVAQDPVATLEKKAADQFIGKSAAQISAAVNSGDYRNAIIVELKDSIAPGETLIEDGVSLTGNDLHLMIGLKKASLFDVSAPRVSIFVRMEDGVCVRILKARKFAK
jgi:hypothetical protein